jgi:hypothetical protein
MTEDNRLLFTMMAEMMMMTTTTILMISRRTSEHSLTKRGEKVKVIPGLN